MSVPERGKSYIFKTIPLSHLHLNVFWVTKPDFLNFLLEMQLTSPSPVKCTDGWRDLLKRPLRSRCPMSNRLGDIWGRKTNRVNIYKKNSEVQLSGVPGVFSFYLQMLSMEMSLSCSYMEGWSFLFVNMLTVDWQYSFVTFILMSPVPKENNGC